MVRACIVPSGAGPKDQLLRRAAFAAGHPDAEFWHEPPYVWCRVTLRGRHQEVRGLWLALLLDTLERLEEMDHIEADFPGWHVWLSSIGRWWAVRQGPDARCGKDDPRPMTVSADRAAGLRAELASVTDQAERQMIS